MTATEGREEDGDGGMACAALPLAPCTHAPHFNTPPLHPRGSPWKGLVLALGLAGTSLLQTLLVNMYFHSLYRLCAHLKCSLVDMLYRKSLRISCGARSELGAGVVNNLQSNDAAKLCEAGYLCDGGFAGDGYLCVCVLDAAGILWLPRTGKWG